ncbi:MAG: hypothetical protein HW387_1547 [Parachlamydiales bacterium]|nr:hypothetical protein [Parachlamydiales bacterium]
MRTKRTFLLLEVLMAIALVAVFAAPLMRWPIKHYRSQINRLEAFELQRAADWTFTEIKELLYKEAIPWEKLPEKEQIFVQTLTDIQIQVPNLTARTIHRSYTLKCKGEKEGIHGEIFRLYRVDIDLGAPKPYRYRVLVQRIPEESKK